MYNINTQKLGVHLERRIKVEQKIIRLINSMHYLLEYVFILFEEENYQLVVIRCGEIITDEHYDTVKGAKIAFLKFFSYMAVNEKIRAKWSPIYTPDNEWLEKRLKGSSTM
jgi:hypothetical protein